MVDHVAIKAKLEALLQSDGYRLPAGMTLRELKGSNVPAHKRLFKKIKKGMKAWCVKQAHCFKLPVQYMLMLMRNCPMHADQNMSKQLLVLALMLKTAFEIDCWNGNAKPLEDDESATGCCLTVLRNNFYGLICIEKRCSEILEKQGSQMSFGDFTFRFKGQNVCEFFNVQGHDQFFSGMSAVINAFPESRKKVMFQYLVRLLCLHTWLFCKLLA